MKLDVVSFGEQLLSTGDLDPIYIMLHYSCLPIKQKRRWCVAYWLFYHAGVASTASEKLASDFWGFIRKEYPHLPRGTERRHFRGAAGLKSIKELEAAYPQPEQFVAYVTARSFGEVVKKVTEHRLFGPWIAFKIADMLERVLGSPVEFSDCNLLGLYKEPRQGAVLAAGAWGLTDPEQALQHLQKRLFHYTAPPGRGRTVELQEVETVLCKWKSYLNGHYYVGKDIIEVGHALLKFGLPTPSRTAQVLAEILEQNTRLPRLI